MYPTETRNHDQLARFAFTYLEIFPIHAGLGEGLYFFGAIANSDGQKLLGQPERVSFSGAGTAEATAFASCVGEAIEYFSHILAAKRYRLNSGPWRTLATTDMIQWLDLALSPAEQNLLIVDAIDASSGSTVPIPACLMLRVDCEPSVGREMLGWGNGCAAGATLEAAQTAALCEVVERDAIAMWWLGDGLARPIEAVRFMSGASLAEFQLWDWSARTAGRFQLLDISTEIGLPCVAAVAADTDGLNVTFGFGCHPDLEKACLSAMRELAQMELGRRLVLDKVEHLGESLLDAWEKTLLKRLKTLSFHDCKRLWDTETHDGRRPLKVAEAGTLGTILSKRGFSSYILDLTDRSIGVPAVKALIPALQPYPSQYSSKRLQDRPVQAGMSFPNRGGWAVL